MALTPVKVLLFLLGGTTAAGTTAYVAGVFDPLFDRPAGVSTADPAAPVEQKLAELPPQGTAAEQPAAGASGDADLSKAQVPDPQEPAAQTPAAVGGSQPSEAAVTAPEKPPASAADGTGVAPAPADAAADMTPQPAVAQPEPEREVAALAQDQTAPSPETPGVVAPSFDIVRVEADGSIVIAGRAAANATVEAVIGSRVIGSAVAGADGAFAIVLDEPLKPGDYQIVLRSTTADNIVATSIETAVVSIPETKDGQVLALVQEPGKPAELITVPEPKAPGTETAVSGAPAEPATTAENTQPSDAQPPAGEPSAADTAAPATEPEAAAVGQPAAAGGQDVAAADPTAQPAPREQQPATIRLSVEAVEIEGRRIFVAGIADPGRLVRAYANDLLLGDARASAEGRFLVEAERDLPVGDYIIRVDALEPDGAKVMARAAVPFEREPGENLAAVAPAAPEATAEAQAPAPEAAGSTAEGKSDRVAEATPPAAPSTSAAESAPPSSSGESEPAAPEASAAAQPIPTAGETAAENVAPTDSATVSAPKSEPAAEQLAPKLRSVDSAVIIRRGDTLWRISRRVYGRGVRYSTIYLANQEQIVNPHLIMPGQVFKVPDRTAEGEAADMTEMGEQATTTPSVQ